MINKPVFGRFIRLTGAPHPGARQAHAGGRPRGGNRLMSAAMALACSSATLSCAVASLASSPAASAIQIY